MKAIYRNISILITLLFIPLCVWAQQGGNRLVVPNVKLTHGGTATIPVEMYNNSNIVAAQFTLTLPEGIRVDIDNCSLTERATDHQLSIRETSNQNWTFIVNSGSNDAIRGTQGKLLSIGIYVGQEIEEGSILSMQISDAVMSLKTGENVLTSATAGTITVQKMPNLVISDFRIDQSSIQPGETLQMSWNVSNTGELSATSGWCEHISFENNEGKEVFIGTIYYETELMESGAVVSRQIDLAVPSLLGISGGVKVKMHLVPNADSGVDPYSQTHLYVSTNDNALQVAKKLILSIPESVEEANTNVRIHLSRSGEWDDDESFTLKKVGDNRLELPSSVIISSGQSGVYFNAKLKDNEQLDKDSVFTISASGNGYPVETQSLIVIDNEYPNLTLTSSETIIKEGESFELTVKSNKSVKEPLVVSFTCDNSKYFSFPSQVTIPAGKSSAKVDVSCLDDDVPGLDLSCTFIASAAYYNSGETVVILQDDDMPMLEMTLTPDKVSESAGPVSVAGILRRTSNQDKKITIKLSDDSNGNLYFGNRTLEMAKGVDEIHFNFGPIDNVEMEGDRTYNITAAVYLSSCSCSANGQSAGTVTAKLQVFDNDGPALQLSSSSSTLKEGGTATLTITRNTSTEKPLSVSLSSDFDDNLIYDHTVVIPAGEKSVSVEIKSKANDVSGDSQTVTFTTTAQDFSSGTCWLMITDQTLPDARISNIIVDMAESFVGETVTLSMEILNDGAAVLSDATPVKIYRVGESAAIATVYTSAIKEGEKQVLSKSITLPLSVGVHHYYAVVNEKKVVQELSYTNNRSADVVVRAISNFSVQISTDKKTYQQGETVQISGQLSGKNVSERDVDIYLINKGTRQKVRVTTNAQGAFTKDWVLYAAQSGHFAVGACYPDEMKTDEMAAFDVYGLKRTDRSSITHELTCGETVKGKIGIVNPTNLNLSGVKAEVVSCPENYSVMVDIPTVIKGGETVQLNYLLTGTDASPERDWDEVKVLVTTTEGATLSITMYAYCRNPRAEIVCNVEEINATITKGTTRNYPIQVVNVGGGNSGEISLALPPYISCASGNMIASLNPNDTTNIVLCFQEKDAMQLNVPITGTIGINSFNGNSKIIKFSLELVSEDKGNLVVDVCDEFTYNTAEAPHVANAQVAVKHPVTGVVLAQGRTGSDGKYSVELPEGYYKLEVFADKHENYSNYCYINPGKTENVKVNIGYQAISFHWDVEETEIEDEYQLDLITTYETNVPMPVVKIDMPKRIDGDNMAVGDAMMIDVTLTNVGLINAEDVTVILPTDLSEWNFEALAYIEPFILAPHQSVTVPVRITRIGDDSLVKSTRRKTIAEDMVKNYGNCMTVIGTAYKYSCGEDLKNNRYAEEIAMKTCAWAATMKAIYDIIDHVVGGSSSSGKPKKPGGDSTTNDGGDDEEIEIGKTISLCDPCDAKRLADLIRTIPVKGPLSVINRAINKAYEEYRKMTDPHTWIVVRDLSGNVIESGGIDILEKYKGSNIHDIKIELWKLKDPCENKNEDEQQDTQAKGKRMKKANRSWQDEFDAVLDLFICQLEAMDTLLLYTYGDRIWMDELDEEKLAFLEYVNQLPEGYIPSDDELLAHKPSSVTLEQQKALVNHFNGLDDNCPSLEDFDRQFDVFEQANALAQEKGFASMVEYFENAYNVYKKNFEDMASSSVCAKFSMKFSNNMVMTRQAFRGTLTVFNGHETDAMQNVRLNLVVKNNTTGKVTTSHEFQINPESIDGFQGNVDFNSGWTLDANATGTATVIFIPTKYAAPTEEQAYSFSGSLVYIDPFTGLEVTRDLYPVILTVKPSPELDLAYFMQRDVYGDDPLTADVEPMEPAEFALIINNKGYGDATNVNLITQQPRIVDNEKGLLIDFNLLSSQLNGNDKVLAFGQSISTNFGTIPAQSQCYAQWWLQCSLLGHFTSYDVTATHVTSYGNEDLSLLDQVTIHELIHGFNLTQSNGEKMRAFLVNDIVDANDMPDRIYFTDATQADVNVTSEVELTPIGDNQFYLTVSPTVAGWNYGSITDPTLGQQKLVNIVRLSDNKTLEVDNFWQTGCTLRDGREPLYEKKLHFVDNISQTTKYLVSFEQEPDVRLKIDRIEGVPSDVTTKPIESLDVVFNKAITETSFTSDDISLLYLGKNLKTSSISIRKDDENKYALDLSSLTTQNGLYVLTVQTAGILDADGFSGNSSRSVSWTQMDPLGVDDIEENTGLIIYTQGSSVIVNSEEALQLLMYNTSGVLQRRLNIKPGRNVFYGFASGVYIIGNKKVVITQ